MTTDDADAATLVISRLRNARDELELAARPPGEFIAITRQAADSILNDIGAAACLVRAMSEGVS
jgi:hypothetical protein